MVPFVYIRLQKEASMCGVDYCGTCHDLAVIAWGEGRTHALPIFGDNDQRGTAYFKRWRVMQSLLVSRNFAALEQFPEWLWAEGQTHELPKSLVCVGRTLPREYAYMMRMAMAYNGGIWIDHDFFIQRRRTTITNLMRTGSVAKLSDFPEWCAAGVTACRDLPTTLKNMPRPRQRHGEGKRQRKEYRAWTAKWDRPFGGSYRHLLKQLSLRVGMVRANHQDAEVGVAA